MAELTPIAEEILEARYYDKDLDGNVLEDWKGLARRVARAIAAVEETYDIDSRPYEEEFFQAIYELDFLPNSPTLFNAGSQGGLGLLSACFVQIPDDSLDSIMQHAWYSAKLFQAGAGVGYNFSNLRGEGEMVKASMRPSSGAVSFMKNIFNSVGEVVKQGGRRRAAMMGLLDADHPEIEKFIGFKNEEDSLENFNISIFADDDFMRAIENGKDWDLKARTSGNVVGTVNASYLFDKMIANNHAMAEPGMIWADNINRSSPLEERIKCVNPCGEATLYNYENCCLGSVNLVNHISNGEIDFVKLGRTIRTGIRFLDDVVDANRHVDPAFAKASLDTRRIGLGITGFADALVLLGSKYGDPSSYEIAKIVAKFMNEIAVSESNRIAMVKGPYPRWKGSWHEEAGLVLRNVSLLAIAPEGSRSLISNTSASIEPNFGREITRTSKGLGSGTWRHPLADKEEFVTTYEVPLEAHIKMQATWQKEMDKNRVGQSISKTNNAPATVTESELAEAYLEAWRLGIKGLTTYVDASRDSVYFEKREGEVRDELGHMVSPDESLTTEEYEAMACSIGGGCDSGLEKVPAGVSSKDLVE